MSFEFLQTIICLTGKQFPVMLYLIKKYFIEIYLSFRISNIIWIQANYLNYFPSPVVQWTLWHWTEGEKICLWKLIDSRAIIENIAGRYRYAYLTLKMKYASVNRGTVLQNGFVRLWKQIIHVDDFWYELVDI